MSVDTEETSNGTNDKGHSYVVLCHSCAELKGENSKTAPEGFWTGFKFNMKEGGLLQKEAFEKTALFLVIKDVVMTNFPAATELDLRI
ncbi:hypothetical protein QQF64_013268 [Cirrhinus molitorella]|uniref:Uncharacterized protein n=1 Tax=Cirrhinus molitorella TaxID=172907 RepID=A0ABR3LUA4_9TELE